MTRNAVQGSHIVAGAQRCVARGRTWLERGRIWVTHRIVWQSIVRTTRGAPLRAGGLMLVTAVLANTTCLWWLGRTMTCWDIAQRLLLLATGLLATGHTSDWRTITRGSRLMRLWVLLTIEES